jgi:hypothetical protein
MADGRGHTSELTRLLTGSDSELLYKIPVLMRRHHNCRRLTGRKRMQTPIDANELASFLSEADAIKLSFQLVS